MVRPTIIAGPGSLCARRLTLLLNAQGTAGGTEVPASRLNGRIRRSVIVSPRGLGENRAAVAEGTAALACLGRKLDFRFDSV
jgi:hypothetical protein